MIRLILILLGILLVIAALWTVYDFVTSGSLDLVRVGGIVVMAMLLGIFSRILRRRR